MLIHYVSHLIFLACKKPVSFRKPETIIEFASCRHVRRPTSFQCTVYDSMSIWIWEYLQIYFFLLIIIDRSFPCMASSATFSSWDASSAASLQHANAYNDFSIPNADHKNFERLKEESRDLEILPPNIQATNESPLLAFQNRAHPRFLVLPVMANQSASWNGHRFEHEKA